MKKYQQHHQAMKTEYVHVSEKNSFVIIFIH